jgi:acyl carrier protein
MTSHASVSVMLALEDSFDLEFPDRMLTRQMFERVSSIRSAISELMAERGK